SPHFADARLAPSTSNTTTDIESYPRLSYNNQQAFHQLETPVLLPGGVQDTLFADTRQTGLSFQTPLRLGRWTWNNNFAMKDAISNARQEVDILDSTVLGGVRRVVYYQTFSTTIDWDTGINLPSLFTGTW